MRTLEKKYEDVLTENEIESEKCYKIEAELQKLKLDSKTEIKTLQSQLEESQNQLENTLSELHQLQIKNERAERVKDDLILQKQVYYVNKCILTS